MAFSVIDGETGEVVAGFQKRLDARRFARKLDAYEIWDDDANLRIEFCEDAPSDPRAREALGFPPLPQDRDDTPSLPPVPAR